MVLQNIVTPCRVCASGVKQLVLSGVCPVKNVEISRFAELNDC